MAFREGGEALTEEFEAWKADEASRRCGLNDSAVRSWQRGRQVPRSDALIMFCREFGVSADWLLGVGKDR